MAAPLLPRRLAPVVFFSRPPCVFCLHLLSFAPIPFFFIRSSRMRSATTSSSPLRWTCSPPRDLAPARPFSSDVCHPLAPFFFLDIFPALGAANTRSRAANSPLGDYLSQFGPRPSVPQDGSVNSRFAAAGSSGVPYGLAGLHQPSRPQTMHANAGQRKSLSPRSSPSDSLFASMFGGGGGSGSPRRPKEGGPPATASSAFRPTPFGRKGGRGSSGRNVRVPVPPCSSLPFCFFLASCCVLYLSSFSLLFAFMVPALCGPVPRWRSRRRQAPRVPALACQQQQEPRFPPASLC